MPSATPIRPKLNQLLAAMPPQDRAQLAKYLEPVQLSAGDMLREPGEPQPWAYFPDGAIIAVVHVMESGSSGEISIIGSGGMLGLSLFMGGGTTPTNAVVLSKGPARRMRGEQLRQVFERGGEPQRLLLRYTQAFMTQMGQTSVCNRHHSIDQQLCRWLLMSMDRLPSNRLIMTQEQIANMLGVRREGVTAAAGKLQRAGVISYSRGRIKVLDRTLLESLSCECYEVVRGEYARLMPWHLAANVAAVG